MTGPGTAAHGDPQAEVAAAAGAFAAAAERALAAGAEIASADIERAMSAAVKLYAAKTESEQTLAPPVASDRVTPTEVVVVVSEMLRAVDVSVFDLAMWYRRPR